MSQNQSEPSWISTLSVIVAFGSLFISHEAMKSQTKQHMESIAQSQAQFTKSQKVSQEQFAETLENAVADLRLSHNPYLQFEQIGTVFVERSKSNGWQRAGLNEGRFESREQFSLPEIENLGRGPAFQVELVWVIKKINGSDIVQISETSTPPERNLNGEEQNIRIDWIPEKVAADSRREIKRLDGEVFLRCRNLEGDQLQYSMTVQISTNYFDAKPFLSYTFTGWECDSCKPTTSRDQSESPPVKRREVPEPPV